MWRCIPLQQGFVEIFLGDSCAFLLFLVLFFGGGFFLGRGECLVLKVHIYTKANQK